MKKAVILLSGGLDSATCLAYAKDQGFICYTLGFNYGQKHQAELAAAKKIAAELGAIKHEVVTLSIGNLGGSALTDHAIAVPDYQATPTIPVTYVPARNTVFLSIALGYAEIIDADAIFIGVSAIDYSGYPDCRPEYIQSFQAMANLATKRGIEGKPIHIMTPLIQLSKAETIKLGIALGIDYSMTVSCYRATESAQACGLCDSCQLRIKGFEDAAVMDPTHYV